MVFAGSNVLSQLARMRQQLQTERRRVEQDLKKTRVSAALHAGNTSWFAPLPTANLLEKNPELLLILYLLV